ncbi:MAG: glycosyltransferase N-terminal domain-containing protein [Bacteroidota bacterium]|nr:glycosyltransferase N-terminal domain-containing protein [Bacteroidota bacterium]MDP4216961.1 glycosyltransferase N-terminal domain-containing protein [Bacteroidota bacterium]MDP4244299.1 glycosyltransferase N-terminal domain-containing protein [Bacteroidota bacterium]MDP4252771.1 glycosyltransferase N-terminal domain-containing protein [Bacteroidota bacterium]MDP4257544.1 glycosyltransferase N-terminal domain-containing protein [Bacteroidota bacterium]
MSILFYHIFLWLYRMGIRLIAPWNPKARRWIKGREGIFDRIREEFSEKYPLIWMHCASLGEFEQGRTVLERLRELYPGYKILVTFFSPSGYENRKDYAGADHIFYLPLDSRKNARLLIDLVQPSLVIWVKYEYWFYYLLELKKRNIPTLLLSAVFRPDQPFFRWYGRLHRYMLECFSQLFVQTEASKQLLSRLGLSENVVVSGDTRFDRVIEIAGREDPLPLIAAFCGNHPVIVAGSTWEEDDEELDHYANTHPGIRFIIAPHEVEEERILEVEKLFRFCIRYSQLEREQGPRMVGDRRPPNVLIIDNMGMLSRLYKYATITYVGGGFGDDGVHNVLEAAVYGKPVVFGPVIEKYVEAVELADCGGGLVIDSALEAEAVFERLLGNAEEYRLTCEASRNYVHARKGATEKVTRYIQEKRLLTS